MGFGFWVLGDIQLARTLALLGAPPIPSLPPAPPAPPALLIPRQISYGE